VETTTAGAQKKQTLLATTKGEDSRWWTNLMAGEKF